MSRQLFLVVVLGAAVGCNVVSKPEDGEGVLASSLAPGAALFVVGNTTLSSADNVLSQRLQTLGFSVVVRGDAAATAGDATGKSLVVISSTSASGNVGTKFKSVAVPVLLWESGLLDDMGMVSASTNLGVTTGQTRVNVVAPSSDPMAAGLTGSQTVVSSSSTFSWGQPAAQAVVVGRLDTDSSKAVLFRYDKGSTMVGLNAPERRVAVFLEDVTSSALNTAGWSLIDAAIKWAAYVTAACTPGATQCSSGGVQMCNASGQWGTPVICGAGTTCMNGACVISCTPGATQCASGGVQTCNASGQWGTPVICSAGTTCANGACTSVCTPGVSQCIGGALQTCGANGQWGTPVICSAGSSCVNGGCAIVGVCTPGVAQCSGNGYQICGANGQWGAVTICSNQACVSGACVGVCTPGATQCNGQGVQVCSSAGAWSAPVSCGP